MAQQTLTVYIEAGNSFSLPCKRSQHHLISQVYLPEIALGVETVGQRHSPRTRDKWGGSSCPSVLKFNSFRKAIQEAICGGLPVKMVALVNLACLLTQPYQNYNQDLEDGSEIGGSGVHFPSTPVKYLADLRSRANSRQYSSIYEDRRPKIEDIERSDSKKSA